MKKLPFILCNDDHFLNPMKIILKNLTHLIGKKKLFRFEIFLSMIWWNFKLYLCVGFLPLKESRWSSWPWKIPALMVGVEFSCWSNVKHTTTLITTQHFQINTQLTLSFMWSVQNISQQCIDHFTTSLLNENCVICGLWIYTNRHR